MKRILASVCWALCGVCLGIGVERVMPDLKYGWILISAGLACLALIAQYPEWYPTYKGLKWWLNKWCTRVSTWDDRKGLPAFHSSQYTPPLMFCIPEDWEVGFWKRHLFGYMHELPKKNAGQWFSDTAIVEPGEWLLGVNLRPAPDRVFVLDDLRASIVPTDAPLEVESAPTPFKKFHAPVGSLKTFPITIRPDDPDVTLGFLITAKDSTYARDFAERIAWELGR